MKNYVYSKKSIITFFVVVVILSAVFEYMYCSGGSEYTILFLMWSPACACVVANIVNLFEKKEKFDFKKFLNNCGFKIASVKYLLLGLIIPFIYLYGGYRTYWCMYPDNYAYTGVPLLTVLSDCFVYTIVCVISGLLSATGEEIGWRGFMVPAFRERIGTNKTLIISSFIWCLWHLPLIIFGGYMNGTALAYNIIAFILCIMPVGIICGLLRIKSGSMWPCAMLHAAHNAYDQAVFSILTRGDNMMYFVSETGIFTIVLAWIIAISIFISFKKDENK